MPDVGKNLLDREFQRNILVFLRNKFPDEVYDFSNIGANDQRFAFNICYLAGHQLCRITRQTGQRHTILSASLTAKGIDFLEGDGGLSAILGVVTVRMDAETIRTLLVERAEQSSLPSPEKDALRKHLESLSETALRSATTHLVGVGLDRLPDAIAWLRTLCGLA